MPTLRQLEYFVAIVDHGSFTRAAAAVSVTQPGLSHQFGSLETELGAVLIERLPTGLRLTNAGRAALTHARAVISHARWAAEAVARAEIAVGPRPSDWAGPMWPLGVEQFVIAGAPGGLLAGRDAVSLSDLADEQWIGYTPGSGLRDVFDHATAQAGIDPRIVLRTEQAISAIAYAASGVGLAIVPMNVANSFTGVALASVAPPITRELAVYTRDTPDPITSRLAH